MTGQASNSAEDINFLDLPDDELLAMEEPDFVPDPSAAAENDNSDNDDASNDDAGDSTDDSEGNNDDAGDATDGESDTSTADGTDSDPDGDSGSKSTEGESENTDGEENSEGDTDDSTEGQSDEKGSQEKAQAFYEKITAPFKANGKEIKVETPEDAIQLMQMGANYAKKMTALKPNLKIMKMLENNGLLTEDKLSFLIDLDKKNPEAIARLLKDSGIDPLELGNNDKADEYKPSSYKVDDAEIDLDNVLGELRESAHYNKTIDIVSNRWDDASKAQAAKQPQLIKVMHDHVEAGVYDIVAAAVEQERLFGRLQGLSDLEAYRQVGDRLYKEGRFNPQPEATKPPAPGGNDQRTNATKRDEAQIKDRKRAASPSAGAKPSKKQTATDFNPLSLSDEEFEKISSKYV